MGAAASVAMSFAASATVTGPNLVSNTQFSSDCGGSNCFSIDGNGNITGISSQSETIDIGAGIYAFSYDLNVQGSSGGLQARSAASFDGTVVQDTNQDPLWESRLFVLANEGGEANVQFGLRNDGDYSSNCSNGNYFSIQVSVSDYCEEDSEFSNIKVVKIDDGQGNDIGAALLSVAAEHSRQFMNTIFSRFAGPGTGTQDQAAIPQETKVAGPGGASSSTYRAWMSARYGKAEWDDSNAEAEAQGVNLGFEFDAGHGWTLGAAATVASVDFGTVSALTVNRGYADELMAALYAQWAPESSPFYAMGAIGYGIDTSDVFRHSLIGAGSVGATDIDTTQWFGALEAGMNWGLGGSTVLTPYARVEGGNVDQDGYAEINLNGILAPAVVADADADVLRTLLGARLSTGFNFLGAKWRAMGHAAWQHEFETDRSVGFIETADFGTSFAGVASGATPAEDAVVFGAGLDVQVTETTNLFIKYDGLSGDGQETHSGQAGVRITW